MTEKKFLEIYTNGWVYKTDKKYWLIDCGTGLGIAKYPKNDFTLEESLLDQHNLYK